MTDIAALVDRTQLPVHLEDPEFTDPMTSLMGGLEVIQMRAYRQFVEDHSDQEFTFEVSLNQHIEALRHYAFVTTKEAGVSLEKRISTLKQLRKEYVLQQKRYQDRHGYIPGDQDDGIEVQSVDTVLNELRDVQKTSI